MAGFIGAKNEHLVLVNYLFAETQMSMSVLLLVTFLLGFVVCLIIFVSTLLRLKWRVNTLERKNKKLTQAKIAE